MWDRLNEVWENNSQLIKFIIKLLIGGIPAIVIMLIWLLPVPSWVVTEQVPNGQVVQHIDNSILRYRQILTILTISMVFFSGGWILIIYLQVRVMLRKLRWSRKYNPGLIAFIVSMIFITVFAIAIILTWWLPIPNWISLLSEQNNQQISDIILDYRYHVTGLISSVLGAILLTILWVLGILIPSERLVNGSSRFKRYFPGLFIAVVLFVAIVVIWQPLNLEDAIQRIEYTNWAILIAIFIPLLFLSFYKVKLGTRSKRILKNKDGLGTHILLAIAVFAIVMGLIWWLPALLDKKNLFGDQLSLTIAALGAFSLAIVGIFNLRANNRRANTSERQQAQELFVNSTKNLGDEIEIIRIGAIHGLGQLAKDSPEIWGDRVTEILCAFIRSTTKKSDYQAKQKDEPSVEITTALQVLPISNNKSFPDTKLDLQDAYLVGVDLRGFDFAGARFGGANLNSANLNNANLKGANLVDTKMEKAKLKHTILSFAILIGTNLNGSNLTDAKLKSAILLAVNLSSANLTRTELEEANMQCTQLTGAILNGTVLYGAKLEGSFSNYEGAKLSLEEIFIQRTGQKADLTGCIFEGDLTNLGDISCGIFTQDLLYKIFHSDERYIGGNWYENMHSSRRQPTLQEKELLVGKDNVDRCKWDGILEFEE